MTIRDIIDEISRHDIVAKNIASRMYKQELSDEEAIRQTLYLYQQRIYSLEDALEELL